ncbi:fumarylacetoacetate hydrolase family protein [Aurantiacibacter gilvus]|uniref:Fumarylacetoacetate hydrolase family protein n=1 Tax=Aurantiacibacter gilvus TaxID=3139141 RepID=A0ABU9IG81_9SPHN
MFERFGFATLSVAGGDPFAAVVSGESYVPVQAFGLPAAATLDDLLEDWDANFTHIAEQEVDPGEFRPLAEARVHAPYVPRQIFCIGANYRKHVIGLLTGRDAASRAKELEGISDPAELQRRAEEVMDKRSRESLPFAFVKLSSCVTGPEDEVVLPKNVKKPDWELELGVVIGKTARHVAPEDAMSYVAGFAIVNDVTARDHIFRRDGTAIGADWLSGKCFPTFLPFGPQIVPRKFVPDPYDLGIRLAVNGKVYQDETTSDMLIPIDRQISFLSDRVALQPGDIICTGSPYGNGAAFGVSLAPGDVMSGEITGLGQQRNLCVSETA